MYYYCYTQTMFIYVAIVTGDNATLQPPPVVDVTFKEITDDPKQQGLFTVNISWTHPNST